MMQGVVQQGTGIEVAAVGKPIAGKTGTTSDWKDAWFVGFSPNLAAGVYVGFDDPRSLGNGEVGGHVAAPIFRDFMLAALKDAPATPFEAPAGADPAAIASATPPGKADRRQASGDDWSRSQDDAPYMLTPPWDPGTAQPQAVADPAASPYTRQPPQLPWQGSSGQYADDQTNRYVKQPRSYQATPYPDDPANPYMKRPQTSRQGQYADDQASPYARQPQPYVQPAPSPYGETTANRYQRQPADSYWQQPSPAPYPQGPSDYGYRQPQGYWQPPAQYARDPTPGYGAAAAPPYWQEGPSGRRGTYPGTGGPY
jgi:membrane peptidoglycan carboxypeptidase